MVYRARLVLVLLLVAAAAEAAGAPDESVALVNGEPITRADFGMALVRSTGRAVAAVFVDRMLVEQEASRRGITVTAAELAERRQVELVLLLRAAMDNARMGPQEFRESTQSRGMDVPAALERSVSDAALRVKFLAEKLLAPAIKLDEAALRQHYERTRGLRYAAAHVVLTGREEAERLMEVLRKQPQLWQETVERRSADRASVPFKGRIPPVPAASKMGQAMAAMQPDELRLYDDGTYWHVLRLIGVVPAEEAGFEAARRQVEAELLALRAQDMLDPFLADLNAKACVVTNLAADAAERRLLGEDAAVFVNGQPLMVADMAETLVQEFGKAKLDGYIQRVLILQEAARRGVTVTEEEIDARRRLIGERLFEDLATQQGLTADDLAARLANEGTVDAFRARLVEQSVDPEDLRASLLAEHLVRDDVGVSDDEIARAYEESHGERILVNELTLEGEAMAQEALRLMGQGVSFDLLARRQAPAPAPGMPDGRVVSVTPTHPYYTRAKDLAEGQVSGAFQYDGRYHIIKVLKRRPASEAPPLESVRERLRQEVFLAKARKRIEALLLKLKAESQIETRL
jgi:parvulin-like peptidyl-prolyl isomerase